MPDDRDRRRAADPPADLEPTRSAVRTIVLATDFSPAAAAATRYAAALAARAGATLHVLHVVVPPVGHARCLASPSLAAGVLVEHWVKAAEDRLRRELLPALGRFADVRLAVAVGRPATEITRYAARRTADFLVLGTGRVSRRGELALGSVARRVVHEAGCPVLTVAAPRGRTPPSAGMDDEDDQLSGTEGSVTTNVVPP